MGGRISATLRLQLGSARRPAPTAQPSSEEGPITASGHARSQYRRAISTGNLAVAELCIRDMGVVALDEALQLVVLAAEKGSSRTDRYARRWLERLGTERELTTGELAVAATALQALPSPFASAALGVLLDVAPGRRPADASLRRASR